MKMSNAAQTRPRSFQFLSFHAEFRRMVYHELLSRRSLVIRDRVRIQPFPILSRDLCLSYSDDDEVIILLQTCKHVFQELQPLLREYSPSRLTVSSDIERLWSRWSPSWLLRTNLPLDHIVRLDFDVKCLGEHKAPLHICPGNYPYSRHSEIAQWARTVVTVDTDRSCRDSTPIEGLQGNTETERLPDLGGIHRFAHIFRSLPALRELHISNILRSFWDHPVFPCTCSVAGTDTCVCGQCFCHCPVFPQLPFSGRQSILETQASLWHVLYTHFQLALPLRPGGSVLYSSHDPAGSQINGVSDYDTILGLLARGIHLFFHEELAINISLESQSVDREEGLGSLHKGTWCARFHLVPHSFPQTRLEQLVYPAETPPPIIGVDRGTYEEQATVSHLITPGNPAARLVMSRLRPMHVTPDPDQFSSPEQYFGRPPVKNLTDFESELKLKIVDEDKFNSVIEADTESSYTNKKGSKFGKLRD